MSIGRQNGAANFSLPRQISARAGLEINRSPGRSDPNRRSDLLRRLVAWKSHRSGLLDGFATIELAIGLRLNIAQFLIARRVPGWRCLRGQHCTGAANRKIDVNGKGIYLPKAEWHDRGTSTKSTDGHRAGAPGALRGP
jgi:hypothetical protein